MPEKNNLTKNLKQLSEIADWFEKREDVDVEEGLKKVKQAAVIIKESKKRLKEIENEFHEVKKELEVEEN
jgi:exonuclease VII small subunit